MRLDQALVERGTVKSRSRASDLIKRGLVRVDGQVCLKASRKITNEVILAEDFQWVSRAGVKLDKALEVLTNLSVKGRVCLDLGSSTGGFSKVLLSRGAAQVIAVDVGTNQLDQSLLNDPRLVDRSQTDVRDLAAYEFENLPDFIVSDLSFISLHKALPPALGIVEKGADLIALVKPQFEVGRDALGSGGVVRNSRLAELAVINFQDWLTLQGWDCYATGYAALTGSDGNQESWVAAKKR